MKRILVLVILSLTMVGKYGFCQESTDSLKMYRIETSDGNEYVGNILEIDSVLIKFKTYNIGVISIRRTDIIKIVDFKQEQFKDGSIWFENLQATRYFWAPNGYGLKEGEAYYQNMWVFIIRRDMDSLTIFPLGLVWFLYSC